MTALFKPHQIERILILKELDVVNEDLIHVYPFGTSGDKFVANIEFVPTVQHCSLAPLIGRIALLLISA